MSETKEEYPKFIPHMYTKGSHKKVYAKCSLNISPKCRDVYISEYREIFRTYVRSGSYMCIYCSRALKFSGRNNPNKKYDFDDKYLDTIDTCEKSYLLGWIASDGSLANNRITIAIHQKDLEILEKLRDLICSQIPIRFKTDTIVSFSISSSHMMQSVCKHLGINEGKKSSTVKFPLLDDDELKWAFIRGFFDGDGCVRVKKPRNYPTCSIASNSSSMLEEIKRFCEIPGYIYTSQLEWNGTNCVDFLGKMYENANLYMKRKHDIFLSICNWRASQFKQMGLPPNLPVLKYRKTDKNAVKPYKKRISDTGYDLTIIKKIKEQNGIHYYDTGLQIQPELGYYCDIVARSSLAKTGWMIANNVGIIDASYRGNLLVALVKITPNAIDIELPVKIAQLIPRKLIIMELDEDEDMDDTQRQDTGGLGSRQFEVDCKELIYSAK